MNDSDNNRVVSRQDIGSGSSGGNTGNPQQSSIVATTVPSESVATGSAGREGNSDIPNAGITDKQGWLQLLGAAIMLVAILGSVRILIMKKKHRQT